MRAAVLLALLLLAACAQETPDTPAVTRPAPLMKDVEAFPRLAPPLSPTAARINAILARADNQVRAEITACKAGFDGVPPENTSWSRRVLVKLADEAFLSLADTHDSYCGGAYPNAITLHATFDLNTGGPIDWTAYLPPALTQPSRADTGLNGLPIARLSAPALIAWYRAAALAQMDQIQRADCADAYGREDMTVTLWLDARREGLGMITDDFPHAIQACAIEAVMPVADLEQRGANKALTVAISRAHAAGVWRAD